MKHGFFNYGRYQNRPYEETLRAADAFLSSLGYLENDADATGNRQSRTDGKEDQRQQQQ